MSVDRDALAKKAREACLVWMNHSEDLRTVIGLVTDFAAEQIAAHQATSAPAPAAFTGPTKRVRIVVAVSAGHTFALKAEAWETDAEAKERALNFLDTRKSRIAHIITADVPLPAEALIEGEVQP